MDISYKLKNFFVKTAKKIQEIQEQEIQEKQKKLELLKEIDTEIFFLGEKTKKKLKEKIINEEEAEKIIQKIKKIKKIIQTTKKELTNP